MQYDPAKGQYYDDARWYSSSRGGFTSIDPRKVNVPRLSYDKIGFGKANQKGRFTLEASMNDSRPSSAASGRRDESPDPESRTRDRRRDAVRSWGPLLAGVACLFFCLGRFAGAVQKNEKALRAEVVVAEQFELLGPNGKPTATLRTDSRGATYLHFFDENHSPRLTLGLSPEGGPRLRLVDPNHKGELNLDVDPADGDPHLRLGGPGQLGASVYVGAHDDGATVRLSQMKGGRLYITIADDGPVAGIVGNGDKQGVMLSADDEDQHISLTGAKGAKRVSWKMLPDGSPQLYLMDEMGEPASVMTVDREGKTTIRKLRP
jgi:hypothetical protein